MLVFYLFVVLFGKTRVSWTRCPLSEYGVFVCLCGEGRINVESQ